MSAQVRLPISASTTTAANSLPISQTVAIDPVKLAATLGNNFSSKIQQEIAAIEPVIRAALILGSPEFMQK